MAFGDQGGMVTELVITCRTRDVGDVSIVKGDAVRLTGAYEVSNQMASYDAIFGEALADANHNEVAIPIKVRGISIFVYDGEAPVVDGQHGVQPSYTTHGKVSAVYPPGSGYGVNVKVDEANKTVHVLL